MPTHPSRPGGRPVVVHTRLTVEEAEMMDEIRGSLSRAEYLRWLMVKDRKAQKPTEETVKT